MDFTGKNTKRHRRITRLRTNGERWYHVHNHLRCSCWHYRQVRFKISSEGNLLIALLVAVSYFICEDSVHSLRDELLSIPWIVCAGVGSIVWQKEKLRLGPLTCDIGVGSGALLRRACIGIH